MPAGATKLRPGFLSATLRLGSFIVRPDRCQQPRFGFRASLKIVVGRSTGRELLEAFAVRGQ